MSNAAPNRKARRAAGRAKRVALTGMAAATTTALSMGLSAPAAEAAVYNPTAPTGGPLTNLLPALGVTGFNANLGSARQLRVFFPGSDHTISAKPVSVGQQPTHGPGFRHLEFQLLIGYYRHVPHGTAGHTGLGSFSANGAVRGLISSVEGSTPPVGVMWGGNDQRSVDRT